MKLFNKKETIKKRQINLTIYREDLDAWQLVKTEWMSYFVLLPLYTGDNAAKLARRMADALGYEGRPATLEITDNFYLTTI